MTCGFQNDNAGRMEFQQFYYSTLTPCCSTKNGRVIFLQNTVTHPSVSRDATQNTTVLEAMIIYWQKIKLHVLVPTKGCKTLRWPTTTLLQWLASRNSHMISNTTNHPMLVITLPATQIKMCRCCSNSGYEQV